ncbi:MAG: cell surface protein [Segetibacter sp.]|nr:cell surface protein [Segetibacter sp.]
MKKFLILIVSLLFFISGFANHIAGGELFYEYMGPGAAANSSKYKISMRLFRDCHSSGQTLETESVVIGIYNNNNSSLQRPLKLLLQYPVGRIDLNTDTIPCLISAPEVCFQIGIFTETVELPNTAAGYTLTWIRCCRPDFISNIGINSSIGGTYATKIPGTAVLPAGHNNSPQFAPKDAALVCENKTFVLDFGASDADGDSLSYSFCNAYAGGTSTNPNPGNAQGGPPTTLTLTSLPYKLPFTGERPLGEAVTINPATGKITGRAPDRGRYVINVCVNEWRNGKIINQHRKDFILEIGDCDYAAAEPIPASGAWCNDFAVNFSNLNTSSTIRSYSWDFGVNTATSDTSSQAAPVFRYADTGVYTVKLTVIGAGGCIDTASTRVGVYPGFKPAFDIKGSCFKTPFTFTDKSTTNYGVIESWRWDFGEPSTTSDVSAIKNPTYKYPDAGIRNARLIVTSSKGCVDSITTPVSVTTAPTITLPFKDTLICSVDTLPLRAQGTGTFTWTPAINIINPNSPNPVVFPKDTTTYVVTLSDGIGCENKDSIKVNVLDFITVDLGADTSICSTDIIVLQPKSDGLQWQWTPADGLLTSADIKNPAARPDKTTTYVVTAKLGKCQAKDTIVIKPVPYPIATAGSDVTICYAERTQLTGNIVGAYFTWTPGNSLSGVNTLTPVAGPKSTTNYVLTVLDTMGCPKPTTDTVVVTVIPEVKAFAGNDTSIVANQPLQLNATGGTFYSWTPGTGMDNSSIANPVVVVGPSYDSLVYKVKVSVPEGCFAEDVLKVKVFKTAPDIFIPTAFTPNWDGRNDFLRPIPVGIKSLNYFRVFNRWGQKIYGTSIIGQGWDGTINGAEQPSGTYIFIAEGTDYLGNHIVKKGTAVLIR